MKLRSLLVAVAAISGVVAGTAPAVYADTAPVPREKKWSPVVELEGRVNDDRSLFSPKFLLPLAQDHESMLFADFRLRTDNKDTEEYNVGLGYRKMQGNWILGGYGFVDYLNSANNHGYWQGTLGFEALSEDWDLRVNGYLPEAGKHDLGGAGGPTLVIGGGGDFIISSGGGAVERALPGFDAEVGYRLPVAFSDFRVFGGMYHFKASGFDNVTGPKARAELTLGHQHVAAIPGGVEFTAGVQFQNDGPREDITTAFAQVRIPLGGRGGRSPQSLSRLERRMTDFARRDVDIVAQKGSGGAATTEVARVMVSGRTYDRVTATVDANTADINAALVSAGSNAFVLVDGSAGTIDVSGVSVEPLAGQMLVGSGAAVTATGLSSGMTLNTALPGAQPTLRRLGTQAVIRVLENNVFLNNLDLNGNGLGGFVVSTIATGTHFENLTVRNGGHGIMISSPTGVSMRNVSVVNNSNSGVVILSSDNVTITDSSITGGDVGIQALLSNNLVLDNVRLADNLIALLLESTTNATGTVTVVDTPSSCIWSLSTGSIVINGGPATCPP